MISFFIAGDHFLQWFHRSLRRKWRGLLLFYMIKPCQPEFFLGSFPSHINILNKPPEKSKTVLWCRFIVQIFLHIEFTSEHEKTSELQKETQPKTNHVEKSKTVLDKTQSWNRICLKRRHLTIPKETSYKTVYFFFQSSAFKYWFLVGEIVNRLTRILIWIYFIHLLGLAPHIVWCNYVYVAYIHDFW